MNTVQTQNKLGQWVPAIPLPFYFMIRKGCSCGRKFWTEEGYEAHYALKHILYPELSKEELLELDSK